MISVDIINDYGSNLFYKSDIVSNLIESILVDENKKITNLSVVLTNKKYLNMLKKKYFDMDHYTDVIAFNLEDEDEKIQGEIYISIDDVLENSTIYKVTFNKEFKRVLIHGVLHLIGYNDISDEEKNKMRELENTHLDFITNSIIAIKE